MYSVLDGPDSKKSDLISPCISNYEIKLLEKSFDKWADSQVSIFRQNHLLFENKVSWKVVSCLTTSGTLQAKILVCFFSTYLPLPLLHSGVHPEGLGIVMDKKLLNSSFKVY